MGTTSNYTWPYPESTGLVKDGWEDIKDLATAADTSLKTVSDAQGLVHIYTTDSGGASSGINIDDVFSADFRNYKIFLNVSGSLNEAVNIRLRTGGSDNSTANSYVMQYVSANSTTISGARVTTTLGQISTYGSSLNSSAEVTIFNPFLSVPTVIQSHSAASESNAFLRVYAGTHNQSTSYDGFSLYPGSGTFTIAKLSVYGIKEA